MTRTHIRIPVKLVDEKTPLLEIDGYPSTPEILLNGLDDVYQKLARQPRFTAWLGLAVQVSCDHDVCRIVTTRSQYTVNRKQAWKIIQQLEKQAKNLLALV